MTSKFEENSNSFFLCDHCAGSGVIDGKRCDFCRGLGLGIWFGNKFLYWGRRIDALQIVQNRIKEVIHQIINVILFILGVLGFLGLGWFYLEKGWSNLEDLKFWLDKDIRVLFFFATLLTDIYFYYRLEKFRFSKIKVQKKFYIQEEKKVVLEDRKKIGELAPQLKLDVSGAYSGESIKVVEKSYDIARKFHHSEILPIHLLVGLIETKKVNMIFNRLGIEPKKFVDKIIRVLNKEDSFLGPKILLSRELRKILLRAYLEAFYARSERVDVTDLLLVLSWGKGIVNDILYDLEIDQDKIKNVVEWIRIQEKLRKNYARYKKRARLKPSGVMDRAMTAVATPLLDRVSQDLTFLAKYGYLAPCVGRDREIEEIFRMIESGRKSVILVGQPGVGKMSIIQGIAQLMAIEEVPGILRDKRLISLSIPALVSGVSAEEAEGRLLTITNEIRRAGNLILVISDLQDMIGITGGTEESLDLSEVLVEPINNGQVLVLATAIPRDYTYYIENTAIGTVLQKINIEEPDDNQTIQTLEAKVGSIEFRNEVYFSYGAIEAAAVYSRRYIHEKFLPEKAIQIMEEVALYTRKKRGKKSVVVSEDVVQLISEKTKIPLTRVGQDESVRLLALEEKIHERIVGQEEAVKMVARSLRRARTELRDAKRPIANLLFLGPTGVGKTELAKTVAEVYFGAEERMIRLDMSEYQEQSSLSRLIGAASGKGGSEVGYLTEAVRKSPFSLLLLDEIEKAHPDILNIFLQVMDDGRLTDSQGRTIDFSNIILIATSNAGTAFIQEEVKKGTALEKIKEKLIDEELKSYFRPEFLNRFDGIIVFRPLSMEEVRAITKLLLNKLTKRLEVKGIMFEAGEEAIVELAEAGFDPLFGARPLKRVIQERVDDILAKYILEGKLDRRDKVILGGGGEVRIEKAEKI